MITFLGDLALISDELRSEYTPRYPYIFNCEYVIGNKHAFVPVPGKINLCSENCNFMEMFGSEPIAVSVVNNHTGDYGEQGYESTISVLAKKKIGVIGEKPYFLNESICLLAYMDLGQNNEFSFEFDTVEDEINKIRKTNFSTKIVVQMHWGIENSPSISIRQRDIGHWLIDHGVDLIIGHHPHCIQPIEQYKGKYICYSLGNLLFANINQPSHYDNNGVAKRIYRFRWQYWNRKSLAINYDEVTDSISLDVLYQKRDVLFCKIRNASIKNFSDLRPRSTLYKIRKYVLFLASNLFADGKLFDLNALKMELRKQ